MLEVLLFLLPLIRPPEQRKEAVMADISSAVSNSLKGILLIFDPCDFYCEFFDTYSLST